MFHEFAAVFFIDQSRLIEPPRVFTYCFLVCLKRLDNILKGYCFARRDKKQYINAMMIRHSLEMPFHLFCGFHFSHICIIHNIPTFSSLLVYYFYLWRYSNNFSAGERPPMTLLTFPNLMRYFRRKFKTHFA